MNRYKRPYLDSCVYIAAIKGPKSNEPENAETAERILRGLKRGEFPVIASTIVAAEVVKVRRTDGRTRSEDVAKVNEFLQYGGILWVEADLPLTLHAQELQRIYTSLKPLDAIHLASAIRGEADRLLTWDGSLLDAGVTEIIVEKPSYAGQEELDLEAAARSSPE